MSDPVGILDRVPLSDADRLVLDIAARTYRHEGAREQAAHDELGMSGVRFAQRLTLLLDEPDAYRAEPVLVKRLRRLRDTRQADRTTRRQTG